MAKKRAYTVFKGERVPIIGDFIREEKGPKELRTLSLFHNEIGPLILGTNFFWSTWRPPKACTLLKIEVSNNVSDATGWIGTLRQEIQFYSINGTPLISNAAANELDFTGAVGTQDSTHIYISIDPTQNQKWGFSFPPGAVIIQPGPIGIASTLQNALGAAQTSQTKIYWVYQYI